MNMPLEGLLEIEIYPTEEGLLAIKQADEVVVLLSPDQLPAVIEELRSYYDTRAQWREATPG
jgi:hypothetical protein